MELLVLDMWCSQHNVVGYHVVCETRVINCDLSSGLLSHVKALGISKSKTNLDKESMTKIALALGSND